jgi:DNA-binding CsgD family transcriptional regulator
MLPDQNVVSSLLGALYESAIAPERWEDFLRLATRQMDCDKAALTVHGPGNAEWSSRFSFGMSPESLHEYDAHYGALSPLVHPMMEVMGKTGAWYGPERALIDHQEFKRSEFYNEFGRRYGMCWCVALGITADAPNAALIGLSIMCSEKDPAPGPGAIELMGLLVPHFRSVMKIQYQMNSLRSLTAAAVAGVDAGEVAIIAVDGDGKVVLISKDAEKILLEGDSLILCEDRISAKRPDQARTLESLIHSAAATGAGRNVHPGGAMLIHRQARQPLQVSVVPFHSSHLLTDASPCALLFISDPNGQPASRTAILSSLYRLAPAECRLADLLLQGWELAAAAESVRVTLGTARFMLQSIFRKTGVHRQSELMRFLLDLPNLPSNQ